jgi:flagellar protein FliO/FliZ
MLFWLVMLVLLTAVGAAGYSAYRVYVLGDARFRPDRWFQPRPEPRLGVSEQANIDGRRKLLLVRRDDVEHLLMIGGPVDIVIEENIKAPVPAVAKAPPETSGPVFTRQPRSFGQAVNE